MRHKPKWWRVSVIRSGTQIFMDHYKSREAALRGAKYHEQNTKDTVVHIHRYDPVQVRWVGYAYTRGSEPWLNTPRPLATNPAPGIPTSTTQPTESR